MVLHKTNDGSGPMKDNYIQASIKRALKVLGFVI